jgi:hypothetical protein
LFELAFGCLSMNFNLVSRFIASPNKMPSSLSLLPPTLRSVSPSYSPTRSSILRRLLHPSLLHTSSVHHSLSRLNFLATKTPTCSNSHQKLKGQVRLVPHPWPFHRGRRSDLIESSKFVLDIMSLQDTWYFSCVLIVGRVVCEISPSSPRVRVR